MDLVREEDGLRILGNPNGEAVIIWIDDELFDSSGIIAKADLPHCRGKPELLNLLARLNQTKPLLLILSSEDNPESRIILNERLIRPRKVPASISDHGIPDWISQAQHEIRRAWQELPICWILDIIDTGQGRESHSGFDLCLPAITRVVVNSGNQLCFVLTRLNKKEAKGCIKEAIESAGFPEPEREKMLQSVRVFNRDEPLQTMMDHILDFITIQPKKRTSTGQ